MIQKVLTIRSVGRFHDYRASGNVAWKKVTLVLGANGYGKSTLVSVLRSLMSGDRANIAARRTLGTDRDQHISLRLVNRNVTYSEHAGWAERCDELAVFDGDFIADNVHAGEDVNVEQRRNLHSVIIGADGSRLANEDLRLAERSRELTRLITGSRGELERLLPSGVPLDRFLELQRDPCIEEKVQRQRQHIEALQHAEQIRSRELLPMLQLPDLPEGLREMLQVTLEGVASEAEEAVRQHLLAHNSVSGGEPWLAEGVRRMEGDHCPFCGQVVAGLPLITAYRTMFSAKYRDLRQQITAMRDRVEQHFGATARANAERACERASLLYAYWQAHVGLDERLETDARVFASIMETIHEVLDERLRTKDQRPLEAVCGGNELDDVAREYTTLTHRIDNFNAVVAEYNQRIVALKNRTASTDLQKEQLELSILEATSIRWRDDVAATCDQHNCLASEKARVDTDREEVRRQLNAYVEEVAVRYEDALNELLDRFNADFRLSRTRVTYPAGIVASAYDLVVRDTAIVVGDVVHEAHQPRFKTLLSTGDKATLALGFFLAHLDQDPNIGDRIVVFDDPFNSQDRYRRQQTVYEITRLAQRCRQVIVLSHDAQFLVDIKRRVPNGACCALSIVYRRDTGSSLQPVDLELATRGRTRSDLDDLLRFYNESVGHPADVARKMRTVLEHFFWSMFPLHFAEQTTLGTICEQLDASGPEHPAHAMRDDVRDINEYSRALHHGEVATQTVSASIDQEELAGYVRRTLRLVNALEA